jgi:hypothetical protein
LEVGKLYRFIPDEKAEAEGLIRVIDESGEDYAFDAGRFHPISLPTVVEKALLAASHSQRRRITKPCSCRRDRILLKYSG